MNASCASARAVAGSVDEVSEPRPGQIFALASALDIPCILGVPEGVTQTVMLPVAYTLGAKLRPADRLDARQVTFWNAWGNQQPD